MSNQDYDSYHKAYRKTKKGKAANNAAQRRWRQKLAERYGVGQDRAVKAHKERLNDQN